MRIKIGTRVRVKDKPDFLPGVVVGYHILNGRFIYLLDIPYVGTHWFRPHKFEVIVHG